MGPPGRAGYPGDPGIGGVGGAEDILSRTSSTMLQPWSPCRQYPRCDARRTCVAPLDNSNVPPSRSSPSSPFMALCTSVPSAQSALHSSQAGALAECTFSDWRGWERSGARYSSRNGADWGTECRVRPAHGARVPQLQPAAAPQPLRHQNGLEAGGAGVAWKVAEVRCTSHVRCTSRQQQSPLLRRSLSPGVRQRQWSGTIIARCRRAQPLAHPGLRLSEGPARQQRHALAEGL